LVSARHEAGNRSCDQDLSIAIVSHVASDALNEIECASDVGIDHMLHIDKVLIEKSFAEAAARIWKKR